MRAIRSTLSREPKTRGVRSCSARGRGRGWAATVGSSSTGLLDQEGDRVGLVDQPQAALA